ncbi:2746_t:CDS:2 [Cetraspora pellucida]|uniref:2746_t:CDS:1 n=1 Tax=Cetraspora pellucida TaxID=1433469 RepID=A0ACA9K2Y1_9GLOM|nr:2746_t:CDS:2 [Cetraspora pellucida]
MSSEKFWQEPLVEISDKNLLVSMDSENEEVLDELDNFLVIGLSNDFKDSTIG